VKKDVTCRLTVNRPINQYSTRIDLAKQRHGCKQRSNRNELDLYDKHGQFLRSYLYKIPYIDV